MIMEPALQPTSPVDEETPGRSAASGGMVIGMTGAKVKITISVRPDVVAMVRTAVDAGAAKSVSAYFEQAALIDLDADLAWELTLQEMLEETGGPLTPEEIATADRILDGGER